MALRSAAVRISSAARLSLSTNNSAEERPARRICEAPPSLLAAEALGWAGQHVEVEVVGRDLVVWVAVDDVEAARRTDSGGVLDRATLEALASLPFASTGRRSETP